MQLSFSDKEHFFHSLAQMLKSGIPASKALEQLAMGSGRSARSARQTAPRIADGFVEAFSSAGFSTVDVEILGAGEQSGRLEEACERLSVYYQFLAVARGRIISALGYPVFMVHLAAVLLSVPRAILAGGIEGFAKSFLEILLPVYFAAGLLFGAAVLLRKMVMSAPGAERAIRMIPVIGNLFRNAALSRFCLVLSMGIRSAVGILSCLTRAGRASRSALIQHRAELAAAEIKGGSGFAEALNGGGVFPEDLERAFRIAEASGRLDEEMARWAGIYSERFFASLEAVSAWFPRLLYLAVCVGVGLQILALANQISGEFEKAIPTELLGE